MNASLPKYEWNTTNESCHTLEWITSHTWLSHITYMNASRHTHECVTSHTRIRPHLLTTRLNCVSLESCARHTYERVTSHIWTSHVTHMNEPRHAYKWVMLHTWMSHVTFHSDECVTSHRWIRHVTHMNQSRHTHEWVTSHAWRSHVTHMNASCHTHEWDHIFRQTHSIVCRSNSCARHTYEWVMSHIWMSHVTHMDESCHTYDLCYVTHIDVSRHTHPNAICFELFLAHTTNTPSDKQTRVRFARGHAPVTHMNASCHTREFVTPHISKSLQIWCCWLSFAHTTDTPSDEQTFWRADFHTRDSWV